MSSDARVINGVHHIVLGGMHDDSASKCELRLLRHGVVFHIAASADDIANTPFHQHWKAIVSTADTPSMTTGERADRLCELLIETSLPILKDLAPEGVPRDRSIRACFHTTTYHLQLTHDSVSQTVKASVTSGPADGSPYGFQTTGMDEVDAFAAGIIRYDSLDLEIVGTGAELPMQMGPRKVRTPDGALHCFKACMKDGKRLGRNQISNVNRDVIRTYLKLHRDPLETRGVPSISGIVVDESEFAGILLRGTHAAESLVEHLSAINTVEHLERVRRQVPEWQAQISSVIAQLHGRGYCFNEEEWGDYIDQYTLLVDEDGDIWLPLARIFQLPDGDHGSRGLISKDDEAVKRVFEQFVPEELSRLQAQMDLT